MKDLLIVEQAKLGVTKPSYHLTCGNEDEHPLLWKQLSLSFPNK